MSDERPARQMSTLTGTSRTLERAVHGLQMNAARLLNLLAADADADPPPSPGLTRLADALRSLSPEETATVNALLSGRPKRKPK